MAPCTICGHALRPGDRFCMRCGAPRGGGQAERQWEYAHIIPRRLERDDRPQRGAATTWVYEAIGTHPSRGEYSVRRSEPFAVADVAYGPTLDWNGRLEGQEALTLLLAHLGTDGWQLLADQEAVDLLLAQLGTDGWQRLMRHDKPAWSQFTFRRPVKP